MQTIIIAALALIVLVVLVLIFTGKTGQTGKQIDKTAEPFFSNTCEIPGSPRQCRGNTECQEQGGFVIEDAQCTLGGVCCSI